MLTEPTSRPALPDAPGRAMAPDLARGLMLLLIVISNTGFHLWGARHGESGWHPIDVSPVDAVAQFVMITALDFRAYPLFALLVGYGIAQMARRRRATGSTAGQVRVLLLRRGLGLLVIGFVHAALLLAGDILGVYAIAGTVLGLIFLNRRAPTKLVAALAFFTLLTLTSVLSITEALAGRFPPPAVPSVVLYATGETSWLASIPLRLETWAGVTIGGALLGLSFFVAILLGFWAAERGVLDRPGDHLRLLRVVAGAGITIGWLGGLPSALAQGGLIEVPPGWMIELGPLFSLQSVTGLPAGLGYAAAFALLAHRLSTGTHPAWVDTCTATLVSTGRRSLTCYVGMSVLFAPVLAAWGLGLGDQLGSASAVLFAIAVWLIMVCVCAALARAGRQGPAEALLRRITYGPDGAAPMRRWTV
ncbi:MAG: DUF418 domain-containing protein [Propionibacteriales bacterium]|nr:DUF418 domain-containing protein [Propionibacteriales bacterium]